MEGGVQQALEAALHYQARHDQQLGPHGALYWEQSIFKYLRAELEDLLSPGSCSILTSFGKSHDVY